MKTKYLIFIFCLFFFCFLTRPKSALALETYTSGSEVFSDKFADGDYDRWTVESGNWSIDSNKELKGTDSGQNKPGRINTGFNWDDYRLEMDVKNELGVDEGIGFRRKDLNNNYELDIRHGNGDFNTSEVRLTKFQDGASSILASTHQIPLLNQTFYHIKIEVVHEHIQAWVDDKLALDLNDTNTKVLSGPISLSYWTGDKGIANVDFDNVEVTNLAKVAFPVIFIPGIGGSELKANQDIIWSQDNGHGGTYSHGYLNGEKLWVNQDQAVALGNDDYFDVLRLKPDGQTSEADVGINGNLTPYGYGDIDNFFTGLGYQKGKTYFVYNYDWRKDVSQTKVDLDNLVNQAKQVSGLPQVNLVTHSLGGLVARNYIADSAKASKVNKLIELGVPHLGSVDSLRSLMYGTFVGKTFLEIINIGIPPEETKEVTNNFPANYELLPSSNFYNFYNNSDSKHPYPFVDDRDIDNNQVSGPLNYLSTKTLLSDLGNNMTVFNMAEQFHNTIDPKLNNPNGVKLYEIVGSGQPTLGQIQETWWITWPVKILPKRDELFVNGDDTVPLYSASLKSDFLDKSGGAKIYYVEQTHNDLPRSDGDAMQTVKTILNEGDALPVNVKDSKITLQGKQISTDDGTTDLYDKGNNHCGLNDKGEMENNIPGVVCDKIGDSTHAFIKSSAGPVTVKVKQSTNPTNVKIRDYKDDKVDDSATYKNLPPTPNSIIQFTVDPKASNPPPIPVGGTNFPPTTQVGGDQASDQTAPKTQVNLSGSTDSSGNFTGPVIVTLTASDENSGISKTEYSLDNGQTVLTYTNPFTINNIGTNVLEVKSIDKAGNEEIPQIISITIIQQTSTVQTYASPNPSPSLIASSNPVSLTTTPATILTGNDQIQSDEEVLSLPTPTPFNTKEPLLSPVSPTKQGSVLGTNIQKDQTQTSPNNLLSIILSLLLVLISAGIFFWYYFKNPEDKSFNFLGMNKAPN